MNNTCDGNETTPCTIDDDCELIGNELCGHAGYRDWEIPNVKLLQSIVDYSVYNPAISSSVPGDTPASVHWSSTTVTSSNFGAWGVNFSSGNVNLTVKNGTYFARAVRSCS